MNQKLRILNLEDSETDTELIQARLEEEGIACELTRIETEAEYAAALHKADFDLLFVDYKLPSFDGMAALAMAREKCPEIPFIFVSGSIGEDTAIESMKNGATDYVLKHRLSRLAPAVRRALKEAEDKSERKRAEEALRESEDQYRSLFENSIDAVLLTRPDGTILAANPAACRMLDSSEEEICRHGRAGVVDTTDPRLAIALEERARTGRFKGELLLLRRDGSKFPGEISTALYKDRNGNVMTSMIIRDITEQRNIEAQLRHAQKMEAVGTLAGGIAHDFNNILNVIMGYGTLILEGLEAESPAKRQMNEVLTAAERAADLIRRLLVFSRKQVVDVRPINVNETIVAMQKMLVRMIRENIEFNMDLADRQLNVVADAGQLEQVLMNLTTNARDAMPEGGRLTICTGLEEMNDEYIAAYGYGRPGKYALITVADTGHGIDAETQKKIFEPFFTTKGIGEGTGLGLAISYGIIKQHGGYIKVGSEPGKGTIFTIYLPLIEESEVLFDKTKTPVSVKGGNETVLVAEDNASLRKLSKIVLESSGYNVITAEDGEDAIRIFMDNRERVHLVMLDMVMPKKNGKEVSEVLRKASPGIKILFASGYTMDIIKSSELTESGFDFIQKPISPKELLRKVREILDRP